MTPFEKMILLHVPTDYGWEDDGIVRIGARRDIAAFAIGDFKGPNLIFCHGNGESAVSERYWFEKLSGAGVSVICPDYRGYGLSSGDLSEAGCYEAVHAAYDWLIGEKAVSPSNVSVLGYSLGSAIAVELAASVPLSSLILQAPFLSGADLRPVWEERRGIPPSDEPEPSFPTKSRLASLRLPTLVIHGTNDQVIPYGQGCAVYSELASTDKRMIPVPGTGHCDFQCVLGDGYIHLLTNFLVSGNPPAKGTDASVASRLIRLIRRCFRKSDV